MNEENDQTRRLSASNFELPKGVDFEIDDVREQDAEIEVLISIESGNVVPWSFGALSDGDQIVLAVPTRWEICGGCDGEGMRLCDGLRGVAFTREDFDRDWSRDEQDQYFSGGYDVGCSECSGSGKVKVLSMASVPESLSKEVEAWQERQAYYDWESAQERAMGC